MTLITKYNISDTVNIIPINMPATITNINYNGITISYDIEYWFNSELKFARVQESSLTKKI